MGWFDTVTGWIGDNKDWLKPVASIGTGILKQVNTNNTQDQYLDYLKQREDKNYQDSLAAINAYNTQLAASGNRGDGGRAAAARQNQASQMKAEKKGNKVSQDTYKKILEMYAPYKQTADTLLPQMTKTYQDSLGLQNSMLGFVKDPMQQAKLNGSIPAYNVNVPLPDSVRIK